MGSSVSLSDAEFGDFFQEKANGAVRCPVCSSLPLKVNSALDTSDPNGNRVPAKLMIAATGSDSAIPSVSHEFYSASCANCGHTMFFNRIQIDEWIAKKSGKSDG
jgi:predicted nucleic-acid-binding Zn-ribbon protein